MHEINIQNPRDWVLGWLEEQFGTTRECLEKSKSLSDCTMFDFVDGMEMEVAIDNDFGIFVPDGTCTDCTTVDELVVNLEHLLAINKEET